SGPCSINFAIGATVQLTAAPAGGWTFNAWSGDCTGNSTCTVLMNSTKSVIATFTQGSQNALSATVTGSGTVTSTPAGLNCSAGSCSSNFASNATVQLIAVPAGGWTLSSWGGACSGTGSC